MPAAPSSRPSLLSRLLLGTVGLMAGGFALVLALLFVVAIRTPQQPDIEIPEGVPPVAGQPVPQIDFEGPGRTAALLRDWAQPLADPLGIPPIALEAYGHAAAVLAATDPGCGLAWTTLAGIGSVESSHGRFGGASLAEDGTATPEIRGVPLDGTQGNAEIRDTDGGRLDGDPVLDRAMGPMQFIPETWEKWGVDANGDGIADPDNIDDAALTAGRYLCNRGGDLTSAEGWSRALMSYNWSTEYMTLARDRAAAYGVGVRP